MYAVELVDGEPRDVHARLQALAGRDVQAVIDCGPTGTLFRIGDDTLQVECLWRVVEGGRVRVTSADHGHQFGLGSPANAPTQADALLRGRRVTEIGGGSAAADLVIVIEGGLRLEVLPDSSGYEAWQCFGPAGETRILGWGGGRVSEI